MRLRHANGSYLSIFPLNRTFTYSAKCGGIDDDNLLIELESRDGAMNVQKTGVSLRTAGGHFDGIPYMQIGDAPDLLVINGGQGFVRRPDPARAARDAGRVARILPRGSSFILLGYDPEPEAGLTADDIVHRVASTIEEFWSGPVRVIGVSYGGMVAARLAALRPDLVRRLCLVASAHRFSTEGRHRVERQIAFAEQRDFVGFTRDFTTLFRRRWLNTLVKLRVALGRNSLAATMAEPDTIIRYLRALLDESPVALDKINVPTLIIGGSDDQFFGEGVMDEMAAQIPGAVLRVLQGETHMAPAERSRDVAAAIGPQLCNDGCSMSTIGLMA